MKEKVINFFKSIGVYPIKDYPTPFDYDFKDYDLKNESDNAKIVEHRDFLKTVLEEESNRLGFIESKTSQMISQTSIVFSLVGLFIPIIIQKSGDTPLEVKLGMLILILLAFGFYLLSITNALKNFNVNKFRYPVSYPGNVLDFKDKSIEEFNSELIRDYLFCINKTVLINNRKATNLLHSYKTFKIGNFLTGILVIVVCSMLIFSKETENKVSIKDPIEIKRFDSLIKNAKPVIIYKHDTIYKRDTVYIK